MAHKKKFVAFLITALIVSGMLVVCLRQLPADGREPADPKFKAGFLFAGDPNFPAGADSGLGSQELFYKTMFMVVLVAVLGVAAVYASKKLLPRIANLPGKEIRIVETVHLGPRKTLHLLRIGNQWLLIGSTNENITKLADVTDALADLSTQDMDTVRGAAQTQTSAFGGPEV
jgi:flagellar biosynthetic protein FliO